MKFRKITRMDIKVLDENRVMQLEKTIKSNMELTELEKEKYFKLLDYILSQTLRNGLFFDTEDCLILNIEMNEFQSVLEISNDYQVQLMLSHFLSKNLIEYYIDSNVFSKTNKIFIPKFYLLIPDIFNDNGVKYSLPEENMYF